MPIPISNPKKKRFKPGKANKKCCNNQQLYR
jgi:hypothetical protein